MTETIGPRSQAFWDRYFMDIAQAASSASKDPSTKVGAVITRPDRSIVSTGYNGFPKGIEDTHERLHNREQKYALVVHGELNAILTAREPLHGYTLYTWPFATCSDCAKIVIQSGIKRVVAPAPPPELLDRWAGSLQIASNLYEEAGVEFMLLNMEDT